MDDIGERILRLKNKVKRFENEYQQVRGQIKIVKKDLNDLATIEPSIESKMSLILSKLKDMKTEHKERKIKLKRQLKKLERKVNAK